MDHRPSEDLLESTHDFPGVYQIKAIGRGELDFEARLLDVVKSVLGGDSELEHSVRTTPGGRHQAITLQIGVQNAEQVREVYARIRALEGLLLLL
jgi:putative lipoic acid-binding regulatory protein